MALIHCVTILISFLCKGEIVITRYVYTERQTFPLYKDV